MSSTIEARPKGGYDPLAGAERLHNLSNSSDATSYEVSQNEIVAPRPKATEGGSTPPIPVMPAHKIKNSSKEAQAKVAKGRKEPNSKIRK